MANKALVLTKKKDIVYSGFHLQKCGVKAVGKPTFAEWEEAGKFIRKAEGAVHWWLGDWLNYGEGRWGEKYAQALDATEFEYGTLANDKYVANSIELSRRHDHLSFGHHQSVASLSPKEQNDWLKRADKKQWTRKELRQKIKKSIEGDQEKIEPREIKLSEVKDRPQLEIYFDENTLVWRPTPHQVKDVLTKAE